MTLETQNRKADHLRICLEEDIEFRRNSNGLENYHFQHCCLPELALEDIDLSTSFLGKTLGAPLLVSSMTGGTELAKLVNWRLAEVAGAYQLAMGVGSGRVILENPEVIPSFAVRSIAPTIPLFANIGAVQLNYGYGVEQCQKLVDILEADALILHINPLQECIQPKGDTNFRGLLPKIAQLASKLSVPIIAKEVGNGISGGMAAKLVEAGVAAIDVAGAGGTSWAKVEGERAENPLQARLGETFRDWGIPTAECLIQVRAANPAIPLIASGGLRNGLEVGKVLALGADLAGLALPFLKAATESTQAIEDLVEVLMAELKTTMFCTGNANLSELRQTAMIERSPI
ncbi:MAG: type 2 isopentenyl-diphosphate Delta-isomerase [Coleofasciculaceae cyanobacterium SM2_1_6]|nr:type 2 isopentenyl-diphosphate Delta-isomerase [Coleofasciculaceae cyanobacterium SM2_1_6]